MALLCALSAKCNVLCRFTGNYQIESRFEDRFLKRESFLNVLKPFRKKLIFFGQVTILQNKEERFY